MEFDGTGSVPYVQTVEYEDWLRWWQHRGAAELERILLRHWAPLVVADEPAQRDVSKRWAVRIGLRLRHGVSGEELAGLLVSANRQLGVRVNDRQLAAVAMEIRHWYRDALGDPARGHWPMIYTREEL